MMNSGICSVSFRTMGVQELIGLATANQLGAIEWGADVHVPPHDLAHAERVGILTRRAGLRTPSYGSYFKGESAEAFAPVSDCCLWLGAKTIRIWAGSKDSEQFTNEEFARLVSVVRACGELCARRGQTLCFEYHYGTYCNSAESTLRLLDAVGLDNVRTYWQPMYWLAEDAFAKNVRAIELLAGRIENVHVYHWKGFDRFALAQGVGQWREYLHLLGKGHEYFLEFVRGDSSAQLAEDAAVLTALLREGQA